MPYDFERIVNRRGTASLKWDVEEQELPMWVADMDFQTAPEIMAAIRERSMRNCLPPGVSRSCGMIT